MKLLGEGPVASGDARHGGAKRRDRLDGGVENVKRWRVARGAGSRFFLHAPSPRKKRDSASRVTFATCGGWRACFACRAGKKNRLPASPSSSRVRADPREPRPG